MDKFQPVFRAQSLTQEFLVIVCLVHISLDDPLTFKKVLPCFKAGGEDIGRGERDGTKISARSVWQQSHEPEFSHVAFIFAGANCFLHNISEQLLQINMLVVTLYDLIDVHVGIDIIFQKVGNLSLVGQQLPRSSSIEPSDSFCTPIFTSNIDQAEK